MKMRRLLLAGMLLCLMISCSPAPPEPEEEVGRTVNVETQQVEPQAFARYLKLVGTVETPNDVQLSAEVSGQVVTYYKEQGDTVAKGEPILKINDDQLVRERERLEAATAQARENYERLRRLYEEQEIGSEIDYLNARYTYQQNQASLEAVKENIAKTTVTAPFTGQVETILLEEGEMATPGAPLVRLIGTGQLQISAGVPSNFSDVVARGDSTYVWFDFQKTDTLRLPITFVGKSIDPEARTFEVEIPLPPDSAGFKVNMQANVQVKILERDSAIVAGAEYIYPEGDENRVYITGKDDSGRAIALMKTVELGPSYRNSIVIAEGLTPGDQMITIGSAFLEDSMRINILDAGDDGATANPETSQ